MLRQAFDSPYRLLAILSLAGWCSLMTGCAGYQLGTRTLFRPDVRTVYVPMFESDSFRRHLGQWLTEAVIKEIESTTPYKVVGTPDADSVLNGRIVAVDKRVLSEDINDFPRDLDVSFRVQVQWHDRRRNLLGPTASIPVVFTAAHAANFIPAAGQTDVTAQQEVIERLARQIVAQMEMPW